MLRLRRASSFAHEPKEAWALPYAAGVGHRFLRADLSERTMVAAAQLHSVGILTVDDSRSARRVRSARHYICLGVMLANGRLSKV